MKTVILAGGLPSTLDMEDEKLPKPMAEIGGRPILWHIMKMFAHHGYKDFIICAGYKGEMIKDYFMNFYIYQSDITVDLLTNQVEIHRKKTEDWDVTVVDTGRNASISERILKVREYLGGEPFLAAYGDCVSDMDISGLVRQHRREGKLATFAVARPAGRNRIIPVSRDGSLCLREGGGDAWVDACCMVFGPGIFSYLEKNAPLLGERMLGRLSANGQAGAYRHRGFWSPMETARDRAALEELWRKGTAPWKVWED